MEVIVSYDNPRNIEEWNALCKECGNFVQTTMYSEISAFYGTRSIYVQVCDNDTLVGGLKLMWSQGKKLPMLSKRMSQFGEIIVATGNDVSIVVDYVNASVEKLIADLKPSVFSVKGFYGNKDLLSSIKKYKCDEVNYGLAYLDIDKPEEELFKNMDRNHRRSIRKAEEANLEFFISHDSHYVVEMLKETYSGQTKSGPNPKYVENEIRLGSEYGVSYIGVTKRESEVLSANEAVLYGDVAYLTLGGNKKNNCGAGAFEHWFVIKELKKMGCKRFTFGQVARNNSFGDKHFVDGITDFKMRFGCYVVDTCNKLYIIRPIYNKIYKLLCRLFVK